MKREGVKNENIKREKHENVKAEQNMNSSILDEAMGFNTGEPEMGYIEHEDVPILHGRGARGGKGARTHGFGKKTEMDKYSVPMPTPSDIKKIVDNQNINNKYNDRLNETFDYTILERNTPEYKDFILKLEKNYNDPSTKNCVCLLCWAFLPSHLKKRHLEHEPYVVTASFFKNEESFIKLAKENGKVSGNNTRVIIFKAACNFRGGPNSSKDTPQFEVFAGGQNPIH